MTVANLLTLIRIAMTAPFLWAISSGRYGWAAGMFFAAGFTDFLDGYIARNFNQQSALGRILDPAADKILITASYIVLAMSHPGLPSLPRWLAIAVIGRDVLILGGSGLVFAITRYKGFAPSFIGKVNTLFELGLIFWFLMAYSLDSFAFLRPIIPYLNYVVLASVLISGVEYVVRGTQIVRHHRPGRAKVVVSA